MFDRRSLSRIDFRLIPILLMLMCVSVLVLSSTTSDLVDMGEALWLTPYVKNQLKWFGVGWLVFALFASFDYRKLREWTWIFYTAVILLLIGLFFVPAIQNVHRWYRIPGTFVEIQPSEGAKLAVVMALSWYIEQREAVIESFKTACGAALIVLIPFLLILKQPDLGTALVLTPIALVLFYLGGLHRRFVRFMTIGAIAVISFISLIFLNVLPHEQMKPVVTKFIKEYQYERLNPNTYHQKASQTAIALGGIAGTGWGKSSFTGGKWLPAAHTDSVFAAYAEEFGLLGVLSLLLLFFGLIYFSFQVTTNAKDPFGRLLSAGITTYLAMQMIVNMGMMCGFLPISGVPLIMITYGGSSVISTMMALGIVQSVHSRRFLFS